jgi:NNP family nitrate/nitrite transporter-like MFS transporter
MLPEGGSTTLTMVRSFRSLLPALLLLTGMFYLNFLARIVLAPMLPAVEVDLHLGHDQAGGLFFFISAGYFAGLVGSGVLSSRLRHRGAIIVSSVAVGSALLLVSVAQALWQIRVTLLFLGIAAGHYLPSGIATLTGVVDSRHWGKAFAVHELAPNLSFFTAPLLVEGLMFWLPWRGVIALLGAACILLGAAYAVFGRGGDFPGEPPKMATIGMLATEPSFWIMVVLFSLGIGGTMGVYNMLPLYLVAAQAFERGWANTLVALSRIASVGIAFLSGWLTDRMGPRWALGAIFLASGLATTGLGMARGTLIVPVLFLQPMVAACFFPAGFAALARIGPTEVRNVAVSLTVPVAYVMGSGAIPAGIGFMGEMGLFPLGIAMVGLLCFVCMVLTRYLSLRDHTG